MSACKSVFQTFDLAELIFLELSMTDILCGVQQTVSRLSAMESVCRGFKSSIARALL